MREARVRLGYAAEIGGRDIGKRFPPGVMDLTSIRYFAHVADVGSISVAARDLGIAQPALTRRIQRLEDVSGAQLLLRLPRGVQLTAVGREFLTHCRRILTDLAIAEESLAASKERRGGHVALGVPGTLTATLIPRLIERVNAHSTKLTFSVTEGTTPHLYEDLLAGRIELAILNNAPSSASVHLTPLTSEAMMVITPSTLGNKRRYYTLSELVRIPVIVTRGIRAMVDEQIRSYGKRLNVEFEISSPEAIRRHLLRGSGITILPLSTFHDDIAAGHLTTLPVREVNLHRMLSLGHLAEASLPSVLTLSQIIHAEFLQLAAQGFFGAAPAKEQAI